MSTAKDITGMRFGKLVAEDCVGSNKYKNRVWRCRCDCGNYVEVAANTLLMGHQHSCGKGVCSVEDLTGQTFNGLTVLWYVGRSHVKNHPALWACKCVCGKVIAVNSIALKTGHKKSCGCLNNSNKVYEICGVGFCQMPAGYFWFDLEDIDLVHSYTWSSDTRGRARHGDIHSTGEKREYFYRQVMDCPDNMTIDHINHDIHDNRKCNLRICSQAENNSNVAGKGYYYYKRTNQWHTSIRHQGENIFLGYFNTKAEAAAAYAAARDKLRGEFACQYPVDYVYFPM